MVSASFLIGLSAFSARALAGAKTGIFNSIDHISAPEDCLPETPSWSATVGWSISKEMNVKEGDTFALRMPYVYKFTSGTRSLELVAGDTSFAKCELFSGDNVVDFCELQCTALAAVEKVSSVKGTVEFPFTFNAGMLGDSVNLAASTIWKAGKNTVTWADGENKLSCDVDFTGGSSYVFSGSIEHGAYFLRKAVLLNTNQHYVLGPQCHADGMSGYIEIENPDSGVELDCKSVAGSVSDQINEFYFPQSAEKCSVNVDECSATKAKLSFSGIPAGFRPFLNVNAAIPKKDFRSSNSYSYKFSCGGFILEDYQSTSWYMYKNGETGGDGDYNDIVVTTVTGNYGCPTAVNTVTGPSTNTIVVTVPPSETTDSHETDGFHKTDEFESDEFHKTESDCDDGFDHKTEDWGHETDHWDHETDHWGHKTENWETEDCLTESGFDHKTEWDQIGVTRPSGTRPSPGVLKPTVLTTGVTRPTIGTIRPRPGDTRQTLGKLTTTILSPGKLTPTVPLTLTTRRGRPVLLSPGKPERLNPGRLNILNLGATRPNPGTLTLTALLMTIILSPGTPTTRPNPGKPTALVLKPTRRSPGRLKPAVLVAPKRLILKPTTTILNRGRLTVPPGNLKLQPRTLFPGQLRLATLVSPLILRVVILAFLLPGFLLLKPPIPL